MDEIDSSQPSTVVVLGIPFSNVTFEETVAWARRRIQSRKPAYIATANMDFVTQAWRDPELQRILLEADLVVADGIPIVWLSAFLGPRLKARVTGSDLVPMFAEMARDNGFSLFHLGGAPGVAEKAAEVLVRRFPGLRVAGCYSPPNADVLNMNHADILARLQAAGPDLLFVAFGAPKQEKWVNLHVRRWKVPLSMGVGGSLDFLAGAQKRAPRLVQRLALEWLWRMLSDPPRLFRRYVGNIGFFFRALPQLFSIRCMTDRVEPSISVDSTLRQKAYVESYARLSGGGQAEAFCASLVSKSAGRPVVLDLSGVGWLTSLEQGALLRLTTQLRQRQQPCILAGVGSRVRRLLVWCRLAEYLAVGNSSENILEKIKEWDASARLGHVERDPSGRMLIRLPLELTAANLDSFKQLIAASPDMENAQEWVLEASLTRFVDSAALGYFMGLKKKAEAQKVTLRFVGIRPAVRQTFRIAKVESILLESEA
jgi:N-acetylglucosaminyldiphosphoundecaprenol N-acetyl-beta-D-mannosaminyltransferase